MAQINDLKHSTNLNCYSEFFYGKNHRNFIFKIDDLGYFIISLKEEPENYFLLVKSVLDFKFYKIQKRNLFFSETSFILKKCLDLYFLDVFEDDWTIKSEKFKTKGILDFLFPKDENENLPENFSTYFNEKKSNFLVLNILYKIKELESNQQDLILQLERTDKFYFVDIVLGNNYDIKKFDKENSILFGKIRLGEQLKFESLYFEEATKIKKYDLENDLVSFIKSEIVYVNEIQELLNYLVIKNENAFKEIQKIYNFSNSFLNEVLDLFECDFINQLIESISLESFVLQEDNEDLECNYESNNAEFKEDVAHPIKENFINENQNFLEKILLKKNFYAQKIIKIFDKKFDQMHCYMTYMCDTINKIDKIFNKDEFFWKNRFKKPSQRVCRYLIFLESFTFSTHINEDVIYRLKKFLREIDCNRSKYYCENKIRDLEKRFGLYIEDTFITQISSEENIFYLLKNCVIFTNKNLFIKKVSLVNIELIDITNRTFKFLLVEPKKNFIKFEKSVINYNNNLISELITVNSFTEQKEDFIKKFLAVKYYRTDEFYYKNNIFFTIFKVKNYNCTRLPDVFLSNLKMENIFFYFMNSNNKLLEIFENDVLLMSNLCILNSKSTSFYDRNTKSLNQISTITTSSKELSENNNLKCTSELNNKNQKTKSELLNPKFSFENEESFSEFLKYQISNFKKQPKIEKRILINFKYRLDEIQESFTYKKNDINKFIYKKFNHFNVINYEKFEKIVDFIFYEYKKDNKNSNLLIINNIKNTIKIYCKIIDYDLEDFFLKDFTLEEISSTLIYFMKINLFYFFGPKKIKILEKNIKNSVQISYYELEKMCYKPAKFFLKKYFELLNNFFYEKRFFLRLINVFSEIEGSFEYFRRIVGVRE